MPAFGGTSQDSPKWVINTSVIKDGRESPPIAEKSRPWLMRAHEKGWQMRYADCAAAERRLLAALRDCGGSPDRRCRPRALRSPASTARSGSPPGSWARRPTASGAGPGCAPPPWSARRIWRASASSAAVRRPRPQLARRRASRPYRGPPLLPQLTRHVGGRCRRGLRRAAPGRTPAGAAAGRRDVRVPARRRRPLPDGHRGGCRARRARRRLGAALDDASRRAPPGRRRGAARAGRGRHRAARSGR